MRKVICMLLVMLACLCLPVSAAAAAGNLGAVIPYTGDTSAVYVWLAVMIAAFIMLIVAVVRFCKSKKK